MCLAPYTPRPRYHPAIPIRSVMLDSFKRLPRRSRDVWQGGVVRARTWIEESDGRVRRPWAAAWISSETGVMNVQLAEQDPAEPDLALQTLIDLGLKFTKSRPAAIEVADVALGERLAAALGDAELTVRVREDLPEVDQVMRRMEPARECLQAALRANRHVPKYITGDAEWTDAEPAEYAPGSREEAYICDGDLGEAWRTTPGAIQWLRAQAPPPRRSGKHRRR